MEPYKIQSGDTLSGIATKNKTTVADLMKLNPDIKDANKIQAGSSLNLTAPVAPVAPVVGSSPATTPINPPATSSSATIQPDPNKPAPQTVEQYKASLAPATPTPAAPNYVDTYAKFRADQGITALEDVVTADEAQKADLLDQLNKFKTHEQGGDQTQGFTQGRISEQQQLVQDKIDAINRRETISQNNLKIKNDYISTVMDLTQKDYAEVKNNYETQFNQNLQMQQAFSTEKSRQATQDNLVVDNARAMLSTIASGISTSGKSISDLDASQKNQIAQLEMQAGMKPGTMATFMVAKPKADIIGSSVGPDSSGNIIQTFITKDPATGEISKLIIPTGAVTPKTIPGIGTESTATTKGIPNTELQNVSQVAYDYDSYTNAVGKFGKMAVNAYLKSLDPEWTEPVEKGSEDGNDWFSKLLGLTK